MEIGRGRGDLLEVVAIVFVVDGVVDVLVGEELECEWDVVGVEKQLSEVFELEDVCRCVIARPVSDWLNRSTYERA